MTQLCLFQNSLFMESFPWAYIMKIPSLSLQLHLYIFWSRGQKHFSLYSSVKKCEIHWENLMENNLTHFWVVKNNIQGNKE